VVRWNFGEVDEAMFQVVEKTWELIFCLLVVAKCEFGEVEKTMFQVVKSTGNLFSAFWLPKLQLVWRR
jgi:hypothetical protein